MCYQPDQRRTNLMFSFPHRVPRDGGGYGGHRGCGGFEVFAFLAFLLALLDLILDLNDMNDNMENGGGGGGTGRALRVLKRDNYQDMGATAQCRDEMNFNEGVWAVGKLTGGVLTALYDEPSCDHFHLCHAAVSAAQGGPLAAALTSWASKWLSRWPEFKGSDYGKVVQQAAKTRNCTTYLNHKCTPTYTAHNSYVPYDLTHTSPIATDLWKKL
ncbi:hypothetical protein SK128_009608 [Halocaridina rubra]|uniref:Uncharacterized protein n=1 Tax=Halocaridina rubra TaxID=373956 RepID=A0AAN8XRA7_HALRR